MRDGRGPLGFRAKSEANNHRNLWSFRPLHEATRACRCGEAIVNHCESYAEVTASSSPCIELCFVCLFGLNWQRLKSMIDFSTICGLVPSTTSNKYENTNNDSD